MKVLRAGFKLLARLRFKLRSTLNVFVELVVRLNKTHVDPNLLSATCPSEITWFFSQVSASHKETWSNENSQKCRAREKPQLTLVEMC